ncbi:hypothetical protein A4A49_04315 [Nicotiana attenuata]|uniref:RNase H type-1 domain-containing protein n=1 Tax=Nicotiana attenuata TaxID=49451 RepID=A0A1J6II65_NICAT|nr:hypothetical protein A4A49_04315 [Nicotiana attenuata]
MVLEECPLNRYTPQQDEYRSIESDDKIIGEQDVDNDSSDEDLEKEQHYDLLIAVVNGKSNQKNVASATVPPRKSPSPRLTRNRATRNRSSSVQPKHNHLLPMISKIIWNARGIRTSGAIERLKLLKQIHKLSFISVLEPFLDINTFKIQLSMHQVDPNVNDKIWVFWDKEFTTKVLDHDDQQLSLEMKHVENGNLFHLTVIYAKCKPVLRRPLWKVLKQKASTCSVPWCVIGDFNVIASVEEMIGGISYQMSKSLDFLSMMEDCGLVDLGFYGSKVTWSNGRGNVLFCGKDNGFVKINSDESAMTNPGKIGGGVIIKNHHGQFIHAIASPLGKGSSNLAETEATSLSINWCIKNGFTKVRLEADSALLSHWLTIDAVPPWTLNMPIQKLRQLCQQCETITYTHANREANTPADSLSKISHTLPNITHYTNMNELPSHIRGQIHLDKMATPAFRYKLTKKLINPSVASPSSSHGYG